MPEIKKGFLLPSAAYSVPRSRIVHYTKMEKTPQPGDLVYGRTVYIGQHKTLENKEGRIHAIYDGSGAVFVLGNRYAPDYYEGLIPEQLPNQLDILARSGLVGQVHCKSALIGDPTRIKVLGYVCDKEGNILNTRNFSHIVPKKSVKKPNRAKMILCIGTSMNSGKSMAAAACCWALTTMGHTVRGSKITGTASLKDILLMEDNGASPVADFTFLGYPSTYMLEKKDLLHIFNSLDLKYANNPKNYWVVEIADGILQRETAMLLQAKEIRSRIHKLIFCANDTFGIIGGLKVLKEKFNLAPDAISGICSSSPLGIRELKNYTNLPIYDSIERDLNKVAPILL
jgi:hypothetical protein